MSAKLIKSAIIFFIVCLVFGSIPIFAEELGDIVNTGKKGRFVSVAVDNDGDVHLCYWRDNTIFYHFQKNGVWQAEKTVSGSATQAGSGFYPHFVIDNLENAHFVWAVSAGGPVKYNKYNASTDSWGTATNVITDIVSGSDTNRCDICICPNQDLYVVAQSDWGIRWNYKPSSGNWLNPTSFLYSIPAGGSEPIFPQIACGSNNQPVSVFSNYFTGGTLDNLAINQRNLTPPPDWRGPMSPEALDGKPNANSIFIDNNGNVHIAWIEWTSSEQYNSIGYLKRNGSNFTSPWDSKLHIYNQPLIVAADPVPAPRVAVNSHGDVCIVFGRLAGSSIKEVMYLLKKSGEAWPQYSFPANTPPKINTGTQLYPGIAVNPNSEDFIVGWEDAPTSTQLGTVMFRSIHVPQPGVPTMNLVSLIFLLVLLSLFLLFKFRFQKQI